MDKNIPIGIAMALSLLFAVYYYVTVTAATEVVYKLRFTSEAGDLVRDTVIEADWIETVSLPAAVARDYAWALGGRSLAEAEAIKRNFVGRTLARDVHAGVFLETDFLFANAEVGLPPRIQPGHRAFSFEVSNTEAVEYFVRPGSRVDVYGVFEAEDETLVSRRILEDVTIMAVGRIDSDGAYVLDGKKPYRSVTVQQPPEAIEQFLVAQASLAGPLTLVLLNPCEGGDACAHLAELDQ